MPIGCAIAVNIKCGNRFVIHYAKYQCTDCLLLCRMGIGTLVYCHIATLPYWYIATLSAHYLIIFTAIPCRSKSFTAFSIDS